MTFLRDLKKPFNLITLLIAIVSIALSVYFYLASRREPRPAYLISEPSSKVYDASASSPKISVLDKDGNVIQDDIYLVTVSFWNAGNLPIEPQDVRLPITLHISPISRLLDYSIVAQTNPDIVGFRLNEIPADSSTTLERRLTLLWTHLDPGAGARFQIIYTGKQDASISFSGNIVGVPSFTDARPLGFTSWGVLALLIGGFSGIGSGILVDQFQKRRGISRIRSLVIVIIVIFISLAALYLLMVLPFLGGLKPPV